MDLGAPELILILLIIVLLFGVGRIGKVSKELGTGIRAFREGLAGDKPLETSTQTPMQVKEAVVEDAVSDVKDAAAGTTDPLPPKE